MDALKALADPTRRELLLQISRGERSPASSLGRDLDITPSAVSQHLKVLLEAGFVTVEKVGVSRLYSINFTEFQKIQAWIDQLAPQMLQTFDRLEDALSKENTP